MREQALRASSSYPDRAEYRPGTGRGKSSGPRSRRSANLSRLARELGGQDLLGAALGLTSEAMTILVDGRDHARENQYGAHLAARLKDAGIPATWLDRQDAKVAPEYLNALRTFAAASSNKAPIRRANFRRIATAFEGREQVLADALEMVVSAIPNVVDGLLEMDDGRFGHMNPRLMRAGFPDSWLEQAEPDLTDEMLLSLEQLATDEYERHFETDERAHKGQTFVAPPAPESTPTPQPTAAPVDKPKETVMAPKSQPAQPSLPPQQPEFKAGGMPSSKPMAHPSAGGTRALPRSVMAAGRSISGPAAKPIGSAPAKSISRSAPPAQMPQPPAAAASAAQNPPAAQTPATQNTPAAAQSTAPVAKHSNPPAPRSTVSKEVSMARAEALEELLKTARRGAKVTLWRDLVGSSLPFWGNIRRGAVLFRDDLAQAVEKALELPKGWLDKPTYPPATIAAWLTDENAPVPEFKTPAQGDGAQGQGGEAGQGAATDNQPTAGAAAAAAKKGAGAKRDVTRPFATSKAPQPGRVTMTQNPGLTPPVLPSAATGTSASTDVAPGQNALPGFEAVDSREAVGQLYAAAAAGTESSADAASPAAAVTPTQATPSAAAAPSGTPAPTPAAAPAPMFGLSAAAPAVQGQSGPLTQALLSIITAKSAAGTFTETDALALINKLMAL